MRLEKKLQSWREAGLLSAEQAAAISAHEEGQAGTPGRWVAYALGAVGGVAVVVGLIALVAANWREIPDALKMGALLAVLVGVLVVALRLHLRGSTLARDLLLFAHGGLVLAMIGLVGQVYHLSGAPWRVFALCTALALPAAVLSEGALLSDLAIAYALTAFGLVLDQAGILEVLNRTAFGWGLVGAAVGAVLLILAEARPLLHAGAAIALRRWGAMVLAAFSLAAAVVFSEGRSRGETPMAAYLAFAAAAVVGLLLLLKARKLDRALAAFLLALFLFFAALAPRMESRDGPRVLGFLLFCAAGAALAVACAHAGSRRLTNLFTLIIAARIVVLYLELVRSLTLTGFGLILTGAVFCGVAWAWWRLRGSLPVSKSPGAR